MLLKILQNSKLFLKNVTSLAQVISCEFFKISTKAFFKEHLQTTVSVRKVVGRVGVSFISHNVMILEIYYNGSKSLYYDVITPSGNVRIISLAFIFH